MHMIMSSVNKNKPDAENLSENERLRRLRTLVDVTAVLLRQAGFSLEESLRLMENTRGYALRLFPCRERTYDLIYSSRFSRIMEERFGAKWQNHPQRLTLMGHLATGE